MARLPALSKCIATISLGGSLPEKLQAAAAVGFDGVELCAHDLLTFPGGAHEIRDIADGVGIAIVCLRPVWEPGSATQTHAGALTDRAARLCDLAQVLGTGMLGIQAEIHRAATDDPARIAAQLVELAERAARHGLRIGFEALPWARHVRRWQQA
jgi:4-hydroxyphenylpyruvate dioxygenase